MDIESRTRIFCNAWQSISVIYEDYARKSGISYNSLYILNAILYTENCTQKQICEKTLLPKQTVNNVITVFFKSGYIELRKISNISQFQLSLPPSIALPFGLLLSLPGVYRHADNASVNMGFETFFG